MKTNSPALKTLQDCLHNLAPSCLSTMCQLVPCDVPCASRPLITLVVVTNAQPHVVILLFQPQGRFDTVIAALPWQDHPP